MRAAGAGVAAAVLCMCAWMATPAGAGTIIDGPDVDGRWTLEGSPYCIRQVVTVPADRTLIIDPGVSVEFESHWGGRYVDVKGCLIANGTAADRITFTSPNGVPWSGIRFDNSDGANSSSLRYCTISNSKKIGRGNRDADRNGGAIYINNSRVSVISCTISGNSALGGGGAIYVCDANPTILSNTILANAADQGGGIYCFRSTRALIKGNRIERNTAAEGGGILCSEWDNADLMRPSIIGNTIKDNVGLYGYGGGCIFGEVDPGIVVAKNTITGNRAYYSGGGVYLGDGCCMTLRDNVVSDNIAGSADEENILPGCGIGGGGIGAGGNCSISTVGNLIERNKAVCGGGIYSAGEGSAVLSAKDILRDNSASMHGGGAYQDRSCDAGMVLVNDLIIGNQADESGGGVYNGARRGITIVNTTLSDNRAECGGGYYAGGTVLSVNTLLWGNEGSEVYIAPGGTPIFKQCDIRGGWQEFAGLGAAAYLPALHYTPYANIDADPVFLGNYKQDFGSPCINRGMNAMPAGIALPQTDLADRVRIQNGVVDIGAYEVSFIPGPAGPPVGLAL